MVTFPRWVPAEEVSKLEELLEGPGVSASLEVPNTARISGGEASSSGAHTARIPGGEASSSGTHDYELVVNVVTDEEESTPAPRIIARFDPPESRYDDGLKSSDSDIDMRAVRTLRQDLPEDEGRTDDEGAHGWNVPPRWRVPPSAELPLLNTAGDDEE